MSATVWLAEHREDGAVVFRVGRDGDTYVAEWIDTFRLMARRDGTVIEASGAPGADPRDVAKIRRGSAALLVRHLQGKLAMHGAAVALRERAIVLLGRSGQGKSTLAAALCVRGAALLSDDALSIDEGTGGYAVAPSEVNHWLDRSARLHLDVSGEDAETKAPVRATRAAAAPVALSCFVDLAFDDGLPAPTLTRLAGMRALACLVPQVVRFVLDEPPLHRLELEALARLVDHVPVFRLLRPRDFDHLGATADLLVAKLSQETLA